MQSAQIGGLPHLLISQKASFRKSGHHLLLLFFHCPCEVHRNLGKWHRSHKSIKGVCMVHYLLEKFHLLFCLLTKIAALPSSNMKLNSHLTAQSKTWSQIQAFFPAFKVTSPLLQPAERFYRVNGSFSVNSVTYKETQVHHLKSPTTFCPK